MRSLTLVAAMLGLIALVAVPVLAQNVRTTAMGEASVGLADDSDAMFYNPAGLPWVNTMGADGMGWTGIASAVVAVDADWDRFGASYAGHAADMRQGIGVGFDFWDFDNQDNTVVGAGYGMQIGESPFSAGVAVLYESISVDGSEVAQLGGDEDYFVINLGGMWRMVDEGMNEWRAGLLINDLAEEFDAAPIFDIGASIKTPEGLILALDLNDITDETDTWVNVGAEYLIPESPAVVRAGLLDGDFTVGAGWRFGTWEAGLAYQDLDGGEETSVGVSGVF